MINSRLTIGIKPVHGLIVSAIVCLCLACGSGSESTEAVLVKQGELVRLSLDEQTANVSRDLGYYHNDKSPSESFFYSLNTFNNSLQFYDLNAGKLLNEVAFETEGPDSPGRIAAVHVHTPDSIMLFASGRSQVFLTDRSGEKRQILPYSAPDGYSTQVSSTFFWAPAHVMGNKLVVKGLYGGNYLRVTNEELATRHLAYQIDLRSGNADPLPHYFPTDYWKDGMTHYEFSWTHNQSQMVYAFYADHAVYAASKPGSNLTSYEARSRYFNKELESLPMDDRNARLRYFAGTPHYGSILYDRYREVYYRVCYPDVELEEEGDVRQAVQFPRAFTVMILDKDLNVIGETPFLKNTRYIPSNVFVGPKGLYISANHPDSPDNEEAYFSFGLFSLQGM